jgi:hypothetical protein
MMIKAINTLLAHIAVPAPRGSNDSALRAETVGLIEFQQIHEVYLRVFLKKAGVY